MFTQVGGGGCNGHGNDFKGGGGGGGGQNKSKGAPSNKPCNILHLKEHLLSIPF